MKLNNDQIYNLIVTIIIATTIIIVVGQMTSCNMSHEYTEVQKEESWEQYIGKK